MDFFISMVFRFFTGTRFGEISEVPTIEKSAGATIR